MIDPSPARSSPGRAIATVAIVGGTFMSVLGSTVLNVPVGAIARDLHVSIADAALFYCERWAPQVEVALPPNLAAHYDRMGERPSVRRAREVYGEA